jgi:hypothetical protein
MQWLRFMNTTTQGAKAEEIDPMAAVRASYASLGATFKAQLWASSQALSMALSASNAADDLAEEARKVAHRYPSHEALDALEAVEKFVKACTARYARANDADTKLNNLVWKAAGAMQATAEEQRQALAWLEALRGA